MAELGLNPVQLLKQMLAGCRMCPHQCGADRTRGQVGRCGTGEKARVFSAGPHFGEERCLVGRGGSGTIFFAGCNLSCVFCQNYDISQMRQGKAFSSQELSGIMLALQRSGCENINFVTPTHVAHAMAEAILLAKGGGLNIPVVYNCGGYESVETLALLEGVVDIYMPDFKYADEKAAETYSHARRYPLIARDALKEMFRQTGPLRCDDRDVARKGVLVRHLVLPGDIGKSREVIDSVADAAPGCAINIMAQYRPCYKAKNYPELLGSVRSAEVNDLRHYAEEKGLVRADHE